MTRAGRCRRIGAPISKTRPPHKISTANLVAEGVLTDDEVANLQANWRHHLETALEASKSFTADKADWLDGRWAGLKPAEAGNADDRRGRTGVHTARLTKIGRPFRVV